MSFINIYMTDRYVYQQLWNTDDTDGKDFR